LDPDLDHPGGVSNVPARSDDVVAAWAAFVGSFSGGRPDLAERSKEILRARFGRDLVKAEASSVYPQGMSEMTTLKVSRQARDRFAAAAKARGLSVRALLDELSRRAADAALMEQVARQMAQLRDTDPDAWADYLDEGRSWEEGTIERLDA